MSLSSEIRHDEDRINKAKLYLSMLEGKELGAIEKLIKEWINDMEVSLKHKRQIQLEGAKTSGKESWRDNIWIYTTVTFLIGFVLLLLDKFI